MHLGGYMSHLWSHLWSHLLWYHALQSLGNALPVLYHTLCYLLLTVLCGTVLAPSALPPALPTPCLVILHALLLPSCQVSTKAP